MQTIKKMDKAGGGSTHPQFQHRRQRWEELREFKISLVCRASFKPARETEELATSELAEQDGAKQKAGGRALYLAHGWCTM